MDNQQTSLSQYIGQNKDTIEIIGVFTTVAAALGEFVQDAKLVRYISCIFIILVFLLLWELYKTFPKQRTSRVELFFVFFCFGVGAIMLVVIANNVDFLLYLSVGALLGIVMALMQRAPRLFSRWHKK